MQGALVQHAQHDIDRDQRGGDQPCRVGAGGLRCPRRPLEAADDRTGRTAAGHGRLHRAGGLGQGHTRCQIEGNGRGGKQALMTHRQRRVGHLPACDGGQWHARRRHRRRHSHPRRADQHHIGQGRRVLPETRCCLQHHPILIQRRIDGRHLALREQIGQGGIDQALIDAQTRCRIMINHQRGLQPLVLLIGVDIGDLGQLRQRLADARLPQPQIVQRFGLQRELELGIALPATDANVLHREQIQHRPRHLAQLLAQACHHPLHRIALGNRLERHKHAGAIALAATGEAGDTLHRRIGTHDLHQLLQLAAHGLKRNALIGLHKTHQPPDILLRKKALGYMPIQPDVETDGGRQQQHHPARMAQGEIQ